jgi:hypothetical protein
MTKEAFPTILQSPQTMQTLLHGLFHISISSISIQLKSAQKRSKTVPSETLAVLLSKKVKHETQEYANSFQIITFNLLDADCVLFAKL